MWSKAETGNDEAIIEELETTRFKEELDTTRAFEAKETM